MTDFAYQIKENYRLCEYIESGISDSTGPYIDTGWTFTKSGQTEIIVDCAPVECAQYPTGTCCFGSFTINGDSSENDQSGCCVTNSINGDWYINLVRASLATLYAKTTFKLKLNNKWSINGVEFDEASNTQSCSMYLGCINLGLGKSVGGGRFYRFIVIEDNKIVKHMVPVINSKNVPGMYDLITKQFYTNANPNSTTDFGYRVAHNLLPFGYKECEWIEHNYLSYPYSHSNDAAYINTTWELTSDKVSHSHITLKASTDIFSRSASSLTMNFIGTYRTTSSDDTTLCTLAIHKMNDGRGYFWRANNQSRASESVTATPDPTLFEFRTDNYWYVNGVKVPDHAPSTACNGPFYLFCSNTNSGLGVTTRIVARVYYCKIEEDGVLVRDFVPCLNPEGTPGLFDRVHGKFYPGISVTSTVHNFVYQVKDQVWPSYLSRVSWIQSTCSYPTATDGVAPYIMLQTQQVDKNNGFKVLVACDNTVQTIPGTNYPGKAILAHRLPNYAGIYWYPKTATQTGPSQFKYGDLTTTAPTAISTADLAKGFNNTYLVEVNYTADSKAEYVNTDTVTTRANTTPTLGNNTNTAPLYLFTSGIHEDFHNTDTHTIRLYDAEVTQYENVIHHYVPCLDTNLNKPCVFDTKTGDIFYEVEDTNVHDHLTYGY